MHSKYYSCGHVLTEQSPPGRIVAGSVLLYADRPNAHAKAYFSTKAICIKPFEKYWEHALGITIATAYEGATHCGALHCSMRAGGVRLAKMDLTHR